MMYPPNLIVRIKSATKSSISPSIYRRDAVEGMEDGGQGSFRDKDGV